MRDLVLPPFLSISPDGEEVTADPWSLVSEEGRSDLGAFVPGWDYATDLRLVRSIQLKPKLVAEAGGFARGTVLRIVVEWSSQEAWRTGGVLTRREFPLDGDAPITVDLEAVLEGSGLCREVTLVTSIVLGRAAAGSSDAAARLAGSVLWRDRHQVLLEGDGARMSVALEDFSKTRPEAERNASWTVEFAPQWLELHPSVAMRVLINSQRPEVVAAVTGAASRSESKSIREYLSFDVVRLMLMQAITDDEFATGNYDEGTTGHSLKVLIGIHFAGMRAEDLRHKLKTDPLGFERMVQSSCLSQSAQKGA